MGFFDFLKIKKSNQLKEDWTKTFPKEIVEKFLNENPKTWQEVIGEISEKLVDISPDYKILFLTEQKLRLVAMDTEGYIYFSEVAIKNYRKNV